MWFWVGPWKIGEAGRKQLVDDGLIEKFSSAIKPLSHRKHLKLISICSGKNSGFIFRRPSGKLQNSMTISKMIAGQRSPRNTLIMEALRDYGYVDARGMGVRTKVIPLMRTLNQVEPIFEETDDYLKTILPKRIET